VNQLGQQDDGGEFIHANEVQFGAVGAIHIPPVDHVEFHVTNTMLHHLKAKGIFGGLEHEKPQ